MMKRMFSPLAWFLGLGLSLSLCGQVPHIISYQGSVALAGEKFQGVGHFKFALLSADAAQTFWSNDGSSQAGAEPQKGLPLTVTNGAYEVLLGDTNQPNMMPISPTVFTNQSVHLRVWFSDGAAAFQPILPDLPVTSVGYAMVAATVADGAITSEKLAAGAVTASKLAAEAVTAASIAPGSVTAAQLAPNAAAENLRHSGGLVLSDQAAATNLLAAGFKKIGAVMSEGEQWLTLSQFTPAPRSGHVAVWTGQEMIIYGGSAPAPFVIGSGGRYNPATDAWTPLSSHPGPTIPSEAQSPASAFWTGREMLVLPGGSDPGWIYEPGADRWTRIASRTLPSAPTRSTIWTGRELIIFGPNGGHRYDPANNRWEGVATTNIAPPRSYHSAVWTGTEMIIWGGESGGAKVNTGLRYDPVRNSWARISPAAAIAPRSRHAAVWTGAEMIIWGGVGNTSPSDLISGGSYNPLTDTWKSMPTNGAPAARGNPAVFWTGKEMVVWGGAERGISAQTATATATGGRYNPATGVWTSLRLPPFHPLNGCSAIWNGTEMLVFGGADSFGGASEKLAPANNTGARYNPATDQWRFMAGTPVGRVGHSVVWTGTELIVWGGSTLESSSPLSNFLRSGARFNPLTGRWVPIATLNAPTQRRNHRAVWTGTEMVVWGGEGARTNGDYYLATLNTGARYNPATDLWRPMETNGAPSPRSGFSLVWSGHEVIIFGGSENKAAANPYGFANTGARYNPATDSWSTMTTVQAPAPRCFHSAVWAGDEMLVWGGAGQLEASRSALLNSGGRYNPARNLWTSLSTNSAPTARTNHAAVWTGAEMIVCGGSGTGGGHYNPAADRWETLPPGGPPAGYAFAPASVWTGQEFIIWTENGRRYNPLTASWTPLSTAGAPKTRRSPGVVWTGSMMLMFGGADGATPLPDTTLEYNTKRPLYLYGR